jgi:AraC-like DNA-binding protein
MRLVQPFVKLIAQRPDAPARELARVAASDPEERLPISQAHALLDAVVKWSGDEDLGLKAGRAMTPGDAGALDFAMTSAATVREAIDLATRCARLLNDALEPRLELKGTRALVRLESRVVLPRQAADFQMSGIFGIHTRLWLADLTGLEIWFEHAAPPDPREYALTFGEARLRFAAPAYAFAFDATRLDAPLPSADPRLNELLRKHVQLTLDELPPAPSLTEQVRSWVAGELPHGDPSVVQAARKMHMSSRTLARRLADEGTNFKALLDDLRRRFAFRYLEDTQLSLSEVSFLLGFAEPAVFHRAFQRWSGQTPLEYRRALR